MTTDTKNRKQRGMTIWGMLIVLVLVSFFALLGMRCVPVYLNQMKVGNAVQKVASDPELANASAAQLRMALQRFWDIERIHHLEPRDVIVTGTQGNRRLQYAYEARVGFIGNIDLLFYFEDDVPIGR